MLHAELAGAVIVAVCIAALLAVQWLDRITRRPIEPDCGLAVLIPDPTEDEAEIEESRPLPAADEQACFPSCFVAYYAQRYAAVCDDCLDDIGLIELDVLAKRMAS